MIIAQVIGSQLPKVAYASTVSGSITSSATYTGQNVGTPAGRRYLIVAVVTAGGAVGTIPASLTVNGLPMTLLANDTKALLSNYTSFWGRLVPAGSTADFVLTMTNATAAQASLAIWAVTGLRSMVPTDAVASSATPAALSINVQPHGVVIASAGSGNSGATYTWAGITVDYTSSVSSGTNPARSAGSAVSPAGATPLAVTCTYSSVSATNECALAIALR
jgi:hypothetical protein